MDDLWDQINPIRVLEEIKKACGQGDLEPFERLGWQHEQDGETETRGVALVDLPLPDLGVDVEDELSYNTRIAIQILCLAKEDEPIEPIVIIAGGSQCTRRDPTNDPQEESGSGDYFYKELSPGDLNFTDKFDNAVQEAWENRAWRTPDVPEIHESYYSV